jgi:hypothetical protein
MAAKPTRTAKKRVSRPSRTLAIGAEPANAPADPLWRAYGAAARAHGLSAGLYWPRLQDAPHCELPTG